MKITNSRLIHIAKLGYCSEELEDMACDLLRLRRASLLVVDQADAQGPSENVAITQSSINKIRLAMGIRCQPPTQKPKEGR